LIHGRLSDGNSRLGYELDHQRIVGVSHIKPGDHGAQMRDPDRVALHILQRSDIAAMAEGALSQGGIDHLHPLPPQ